MNRARNRLRTRVRSPTSRPSVPLGPSPWGCPKAEFSLAVRVSECEPGGPTKPGRCRREVPVRSRPGTALRHIPLSRQYPPHPHPLHPCWTSPAASPPVGCPADRPYRREGQTSFLVVAWPLGIGSSAVCGHCLISRALCAWLDWAGVGAFPRGGSPAAFPHSGPMMGVAALPSPRFSRGSRVLRPPPTPGSASLLRFRVSPLYASLPDGVASAGPNRVSPVVLMRCLCVPPPSTPSRRAGFPLAVVRSVAGFASKGQPRPGKSSIWIGVIAGGYDDAETAFTSVAARKFASPSCRQLRALSSRFSGSGCPEPEGTRLSGERVITRADSFHSASTSTSLRTRPLISLRDMGVEEVRSQKPEWRRRTRRGAG